MRTRTRKPGWLTRIDPAQTGICLLQFSVGVLVSIEYLVVVGIEDFKGGYFGTDAEWGSLLTGRSEEVGTILAGCAPDSNEESPTSFLVNGFRRVGKSSLLRHIETLLKEESYFTKAYCVSLQLPPFQAFWKTLHDKVLVAASVLGIEPESVEGASAGKTVLNMPAQRMASPDEYVAFADFVGGCKRVLVILLDDAHDLLHPSEKHLDEASAILRQMVALIEGRHQGRNVRISWVLADRKSWSLGDRLEPGLMNSFDPIQLHCLSETDADDLLKKLLGAYDLWAHHLHQVYRRIINACGDHPFFIETVRRELIRLLNKAPRNIDVIDSSMIEMAIKRSAVVGLKEQFNVTYDCPEAVCNEAPLSALLHPKRHQRTILARELLHASKLDVDLEATSGIVCESAESGMTVRCGELMEMWAERRLL